MDLAAIQAQIAELASLQEAGRVLSAANEAKLRHALNDLDTVLKQLAGATPAKEAATGEAEAHEARHARLTAQLAETELSYDQRTQAIRNAIMAGIPAFPPCYVWISAVYDTSVIYRCEDYDGDDDDTFQRDYSIDADGVVTLGDPVAVQMQVSYVPTTDATEATKDPAKPQPSKSKTKEAASLDITGDVVQLAEAKALREDGTARVKVIQPGWGTSGYYSEAMLKRDGSKAFPKGTHLYWDHPSATEARDRPERSLRDLAGTLLSDAAWSDDAAAGPGLYADVQVLAPYRESVAELAPHIGMSIRAEGRTKAGEAEGRKGAVIEQLVKGHSVDFVTAAGAGGQVLQLFEAARGRNEPSAPGTLPARKEPTMPDPENQGSVFEELAVIREANAQMQETIRLQGERLMLSEAGDIVARALQPARFHDLTNQRLTTQLIATVPTTATGAIDREAFMTQIGEAIKTEAAYLARVTGAGTVRGMGATAPNEEITAEAAEKQLAESYGLLGLPQGAARLAARGR